MLNCSVQAARAIKSLKRVAPLRGTPEGERQFNRGYRAALDDVVRILDAPDEYFALAEILRFWGCGANT